MLGYKMYVKSSEKLIEMEYEEIAERLDNNILVSIYKIIYTNDIGELTLIVKGNICTKINDMVINNEIKTSPKWYENEEKTLCEGLEELNSLCDRLNIKDKEILKNLRSFIEKC